MAYYEYTPEDLNIMLRRARFGGIAGYNPPLPEQNPPPQFPKEANKSAMDAEKQQQQGDPAQINQKLDQLAQQHGYQGPSQGTVQPMTGGADRAAPTGQLPTGNQIQQANPPPGAAPPPSQETKTLDNLATVQGRQHAAGLPVTLLPKDFPTQVQPQTPAGTPQALQTAAQATDRPPNFPPRPDQVSQPQVQPIQQPSVISTEDPRLQGGQVPPSELGPSGQVQPMLSSMPMRPPMGPVPEIAAAEKKAGEMPTEREFEKAHHVSPWRKAGAITGGILMGVGSANPWIGRDVYNAVEHGRYRGALNDWNQQMQKALSMADLAVQQRTQELRSQQQFDEEQRLRQDWDFKRSEILKNHAAELNYLSLIAGRPDAQTAQDYKLQLEAFKHYKPEELTFLTPQGGQMKVWHAPPTIGPNGEMIPGAYYGPPEKTGGAPAKIPDEVINQGSILPGPGKRPVSGETYAEQMILSQAQREGWTPEQTQSALAANRLRFHPTVAADPTAKEKRATDLKRSKLKLGEEEAAVAPGNITGLIKQGLLNPMTFADKRLFNNEVTPLVQRELAKHGLVFPAAPTTKQKDAHSAGIRTLDMIDHVEQLFVSKPELANYLTFFKTAEGHIEVAIGRDISGEKPDVQTAVADMRNSLNYILTSEAASAGGGGRGANYYMIKLLGPTSPRADMSPEYMQGAINSARSAANVSMGVTNQEMFGPNFYVKGPDGKPLRTKAGDPVPRFTYGPKNSVLIYNDENPGYDTYGEQ